MSHKKNQTGSVLIIAIFVIVVMGMLGLTLVRLQWSNQDTLTREVLGTQAWFLAHSGNEWGLTFMYPLDQTATAVELGDRCTELNNATPSPPTPSVAFNADESSAILIDNTPCTSLTISCTQRGAGEFMFFKISSVAVCGGVNTSFEVSREQEVWARAME